MTAKELLKFVLVPAFVAGTLVQNFRFSFNSFSMEETIAIISMLAAFVGYLVYLYEVKRRAKAAKAKALALEEFKERKRELERQRSLEASRYLWERNFSEIMSWRDQITGCGSAKEVSPWQ